MKNRLLPVFLLTMMLMAAPASANGFAQTVRIGLYYNIADNANIAEWVTFNNNSGLGASFLLTERLDIPAIFSHVTVDTGPGKYVQVGAGQNFESAWQLAREARNNWNFKAYVAYRQDGSKHPFKVWVEGVEAAVRVQYHGAFAVNAGADSLRLCDVTGNSPGLVAADRARILLTPVTRVPTNLSASGHQARQYEGSFEIRGTAGKVSVVNVLNTEQYVAGVVPYEMSDSWPLEALKAQAVAARSFAVANRSKHLAQGFELCDSALCCQKYAGFSASHVNSRRAVEETTGQVAKFGGQVVQLFYHSNSGGHTENSEDVWSSALPFARAVFDPFSVSEPLVGHLVSRSDSSGEFPARWLLSFTREELELLLAAKELGVGTLLEIRSLSRSAGGRHLEILVRGTDGERVLTRSATRFTFNLFSSLYEIIPIHRRVHAIGADGRVREISVSERLSVTGPGGTVTSAASGVWMAGIGRQRQVSVLPVGFSFDGRGWGHGVGMSQWGAFEMARHGYTYSQILQYYFQGITIGTQ